MAKKSTNKGGDYDALMRQARKRIAKMDASDGSAVDAFQFDLGLRTVMSALECAIQCQDWGITAEAMVMLQQIEFKYRPADQKSGGFYLMEK